jgi:hypothetical protein
MSLRNDPISVEARRVEMPASPLRATADTMLDEMTATDELRQRGARASEHNRSRRRRESRRDRARPSTAWSCICIVTSAFARSDTAS